MKKDGLTIRSMQPQDVAAALRLEADLPGGWGRKQLEEELARPAGFQFVVRREKAAGIEAFVCGRLVVDEAEILKLNVAPKARRQGIGSELLDFALSFAAAKGAKNCFLELRASNTAAGRLYEKKGFVRAGTRRNYYQGPLEDAILMRLSLNPSTDNVKCG